MPYTDSTPTVDIPVSIFGIPTSPRLASTGNRKPGLPLYWSTRRPRNRDPVVGKTLGRIGQLHRWWERRPVHIGRRANLALAHHAINQRVRIGLLAYSLRDSHKCQDSLFVFLGRKRIIKELKVLGTDFHDKVVRARMVERARRWWTWRIIGRARRPAVHTISPWIHNHRQECGAQKAGPNEILSKRTT